MILKYFYAWFPIIALAFLNGTIREIAYKPYVGDLAAHQISTFTLIAFFTAYLWSIGRKWKIDSAKNAWLIGLMWLVMTMAFEFGFGRFVLNNPWEKLLHDYDILEGRIWVLILLSTLVGPYLSYQWFRGK
jgi:hypothetical protein